MKNLKFSSQLIPAILSREKDSTWRLFDDKDLREGDELALIDAGTGQQFAKAVIDSLREKKLGDIGDADFEGHGTFESTEKMYEAFRGYYGDKVSPESIVKIIKFSVTV